MAFKIARGGNWSSAATWAEALNTPTIHATTNLSITTGTGIYTQAYTAANSTDKILGTIVHPVASWPGRSVTFTLQENSVDTAVSVTIVGADVQVGVPLRIEHTGFTQTSGRTYRYRMNTNTSSCTVAQSATASQAAAIIYSDQSVSAPAAGDSAFIISQNANTDITVTINNTSAICGSNAAISGSSAFAFSSRYWDMALMFNGGTTGKAYLTHSDNVNTQIEVRNHVWQGYNGVYTCKPQAGYTATVAWTPGAIANNSIAWIFASGEQHDIQGAGLSTPAYWKSKHVSGVGTAASPLVVNTPVDWSVGDYLIFHPTGNGSTNYDEVEYRYIITKNSSTSYVLSSTSGGSENALLYTHTGGYVFNQTAGKNVIWKSTDGYRYHVGLNNSLSTPSTAILRWLRVSDVFTTNSAARGGLSFTLGAHNAEYISLGTPGSVVSDQGVFFATNPSPFTIRGLLIFSGQNESSQTGMVNTSSSANRSFIDCHIIDTTRVGWKLTGPNLYMKDCTAIACGRGGVAELYGGFNVSVSYARLVDCEQYSCRLQGTLYYGSSSDIVWTRLKSGTLGTNGDLAHQSASQVSIQDVLYENPTTADNNLMTGNLALIEGSRIVFSNVNSTPYNNYKYTNNGFAQFTGPGLTDTTTPNLGAYAYRHDTVTSEGLKYRYRQLVTPGAVFVTYGRVWGNSTFVSDGSTSITADLYMPGVAEGDTPSATASMTKTSDKTSANAVFQLTAPNNATIPNYATIVITIKNPSGTANARAYVGDILNAENDTTKFKVAFEGQPAEVMPLGASTDPGAISSYVWSDTNSYGVGTKGKSLKDASKAKLLL